MTFNAFIKKSDQIIAHIKNFVYKLKVLPPLKKL